MVYRNITHESTAFSPNFMVFGKEVYMPVDIMIEHQDILSNQDELEYDQRLRHRLEDAFEVALQSSASRQKRNYDKMANESHF